MKVLGSFEEVRFPEFGSEHVTAKLDTGAFTGALHATKIHETINHGEKLLCFSPFDHPELVYETANFERGIVKSSNGAQAERYFIETSIVVRKRRYTITLSLLDRSAMKWPVLIGRRFLMANEFVVDVSRKKK
jgi:hypothetical protein